MLQTLWGDESLNLGSFGVWFGAFLFGLDLSSDDEFSDVILLVETEEFSDFCSTLGTESLGVDEICQTGDFTVALLNDREGEDR